MFLNLVTTNSSEAMELLDNLVPALVSVIILYIPALILAAISIIKKRKLSPEFIRRERKRHGLPYSSALSHWAPLMDWINVTS